MATLGEAGVQTRVIATYAPQSIRERILPKVVSGECILAVCMTEPHAGTDVANYRTNADIKGDRIVLNGVKTLISRAEEAGMFVIFSRIDKKPGREGIGCVLLEKGTPGFEVTGTFHTMGGENLHEIQFNNCELPLENLVIREDGFRKLLSAFNTQRCLNPSISLGLAEGAFAEALKYARDREIFGKPIGDFQGNRWKLADMYKDIETGRSILYRACATANPFPDPFMAAVAKVFCNEMALRVTNEALQMHGGFGFTEEYAVNRLYRGARYGTLGGGTSETLRDLMGKHIMASDGAEGLLGYDMMALRQA
jgi:alkylation response protein AidB-like acyl-CoA dehydrogenase